MPGPHSTQGRSRSPVPRRLGALSHSPQPRWEPQAGSGCGRMPPRAHRWAGAGLQWAGQHQGHRSPHNVDPVQPRPPRAAGREGPGRPNSPSPAGWMTGLAAGTQRPTLQPGFNPQSENRDPTASCGRKKKKRSHTVSRWPVSSVLPPGRQPKAAPPGHPCSSAASQVGIASLSLTGQGT